MQDIEPLCEEASKKKQGTVWISFADRGLCEPLCDFSGVLRVRFRGLFAFLACLNASAQSFFSFLRPMADLGLGMMFVWIFFDCPVFSTLFFSAFGYGVIIRTLKVQKLRLRARNLRFKTAFGPASKKLGINGWDSRWPRFVDFFNVVR